MSGRTREECYDEQALSIPLALERLEEELELERRNELGAPGTPENPR